MRSNHLALTYGIEEEFFLVDASHRGLVAPPPAFWSVAHARFGARVHHEMQRAQVETTTPVLHTTAQAREAVAELRAGVGDIAAGMGLRLVAAGTHPAAEWRTQSHSDQPRYDRLIDDFQMVGRRNLVCGLHVHVGVPGEVDRVGLMNRLLPWLPLFLALSTSSPFWNGQRTGLLSYRQAAYDEWPRSGIPDTFEGEAEYFAFVDLLARCDALRDGSSLWWAIRPSSRYPTLELRIADACTRLDDALALAAAYRCLVRAHLRCPDIGARPSAMTRRLVDENRWRAKRHGLRAEFIDEATQRTAPVADLVRGLQALLAHDAEALQCERELRHLTTIVQRGTSADRQLAVYRGHRDRCQPRSAALAAVVGWLEETTLAGCGGFTASGQEAPGAVNA